VEKGGVVMVAPDLRSGADVQCWLTVDGVAYSFEASVLRTGVPVPDRSQDGVMLGFLDAWRRAARPPSGLVVEVLPATGGPVSLLHSEARIVELGSQEWTITTPSHFALVLVQHGQVRLRIALPDQSPMEIGARVMTMSHGDGHLLYALQITQVDDPHRYQQMLTGLRQTLGI
jgi:hypothetical protein